MAQSDTKDPENYRILSRQLDEIAAKLEDPDVGIDEAVELYGQALKIAGKLAVHLEKAENRIVELKAKFSKGD